MDETSGAVVEKKTEAAAANPVDALTVRQAVFQMIDEVAMPQWQQIREKMPDEFRAYFDVRYENLRNNYGTLYSTILQNGFTLRPEWRRDLDRMLTMIDLKKRGRLNYTDEEGKAMAMEPLYERHVYPVLRKLEEKRTGVKEKARK